MVKTRERGFTILEVVIVLALMLVMMAIAIPSFMASVQQTQLVSSARSVANALMRARFEAIRQNSRFSTIYSAGSPPQYGVDLNANGDLDSTEPAFPLSPQVQMVSSGLGLPSLSTMGSAYSSASVPSSFKVTFSPTGTVMQQLGGAWVEANSIYVIYFQHQVTKSWAAVTITPGGRFKTWLYQGSSWVGE